MSIRTSLGVNANPTVSLPPSFSEVKTWTVNDKRVTLYQGSDNSLFAKVVRGTKEVFVSQDDITSNYKLPPHHLHLRLIGSGCHLRKQGKAYEISITLADSGKSNPRISEVSFSDVEWSDLREVLKGLEAAKDGSFFAVVGEAGVGKSTFINAVRGISCSYIPGSGIVFKQDEVLKDKPILAQVSNQLGKGVTRYSTAYEIPGLTPSLLDTGGFFDPSMTQEMISTLSAILFLRAAKRVKLMVLISCDSLLSPSGRARSFFDVASKIYLNFLDPALVGSTLLVFTHPNKERGDSRDRLVKELIKLRDEKAKELGDNDGRDPMLYGDLQKKHALLDIILRPRRNKGLEDEGYYVQLFDPVGDLQKPGEVSSSTHILNMMKVNQEDEAVTWIAEPKKMFGVTLSKEVESRFLLGLQTVALRGLKLLDRYYELKKGLEEIDAFGSAENAKIEADELGKRISELDNDLAIHKTKLAEAEKNLQVSLAALEADYLYATLESDLQIEEQFQMSLLRNSSKVGRVILRSIDKWARAKIIKYPHHFLFHHDIPSSSKLTFQPAQEVAEVKKGKKVDYAWKQEKRMPNESNPGFDTFSIYFLTNVQPGRIEVRVLGKELPSVLASYKQQEAMLENLKEVIEQKELNLSALNSLRGKTMTEVEFKARAIGLKESMLSTKGELSEKKEFPIFCELYSQLTKEFEERGPLVAIGAISQKFSERYLTFVRREITESTEN